MTTNLWSLRRLHAVDEAQVEELAGVLIDCVEGGASVSFIGAHAGRDWGAALIRSAEAMARDCGKTLLVLDAVTGGDAERLYSRLGWQRVGVIPGYALMPHGGPCDTTVFYRNIGA